MTHSLRMSQVLYVGRTPVYGCGDIHVTGHKPLTGAELAMRIQQAKDHREKLDHCIEAMQQILNEGETVQERIERIAREDADPKTAAQSMGWFAIEDFAALCDDGPTGFRRFIKSCTGQIVKPRHAADFQRLIGNEWPEYPSRGFYWADHFQHADNWKDALSKARKDNP